MTEPDPHLPETSEQPPITETMIDAQIKKSKRNRAIAIAGVTTLAIAAAATLIAMKVTKDCLV